MPRIDDITSKAEEIQERLLAHRPKRLRDRFSHISVPTRAALLIGPRGTGKTTWLLTQAENRHLLYLSADNPILASVPLYELLEGIFMRGYEGALVDEIHYAADWSRHLKAAYDSFPNKTLVASDSSTVVLRKGLADLSRRFPIRQMPLLSFREYLVLRLDRDIPVIDPFHYDPVSVRRLVEEVNVLRFFREYMAGGFRPFFLESPDTYLERVMNTLAKTMEADIPFLVPQLTENHLRLMQAVVGFLATSSVPRLQVNTLCTRWAVGKEKLYQLLDAMERAHLIRTIRKDNDTKMQSAGAKVFLYEPSVYGFYGENPGTRREAFAAGALLDSGHRVAAARSEQECDFLVDGRKLEVGGRSKRRKGAAVLVRDDLDLPTRDALPLWMLGCEY